MFHRDWRTGPLIILMMTLQLLAPRRATALFDYVNEETSRVVPSGNTVAVGLFIPVPAPGLPPPPYPAVIIHHGFLRSHGPHQNNAIYMAQRGPSC